MAIPYYFTIKLMDSYNQSSNNFLSDTYNKYPHNPQVSMKLFISFQAFLLLSDLSIPVHDSM